jgi:NAD(P)-dependent dehydrogenase (short-subunit alcohol dehydrogenase family)
VTAGGAPGRFEKRVVVITGTAGGQGRAAALAFSREGAIVVGCDVNIDGSRETVALVEATGGLMFSTHPIDGMTPADWGWVVRHELDTVSTPSPTLGRISRRAPEA